MPYVSVLTTSGLHIPHAHLSARLRQVETKNMQKKQSRAWLFRKTFVLLHPKSRKGALVQLVRIHACHAWGHGFESRTHRQLNQISKS